MTRNVVAVKFKNYGSTYAGTQYHYLTDLDLKVGDEVIVDSPSQGLVVVQIASLLGAIEGKATKWVIQKVDTETHKRREEAERQRKVIETKLRAIQKTFDETKKWEYLAEQSPEAAALLRELKGL